jgi:hypothetical protein
MIIICVLITTIAIFSVNCSFHIAKDLFVQFEMEISVACLVAAPVTAQTVVIYREINVRRTLGLY